MRALLLPVGRDWFAVDLRVVREIVPSPPVTPIPTAPPTVLGLFSVRGRLVPFFDVAALLGLPSAGCLFATLVEAGPGAGHAHLAGLGSSGPPEVAELSVPTGTSDLLGSEGTFTVPGALTRPRAVVLLNVARLLS